MNHCMIESLPSCAVGAKILISQPDGNHNHMLRILTRIE